MRRLLMWAGVCSTVVFAACGEERPPSPASTVVASRPEHPPTDRKAAQLALLRRGDLPPAWRAGRHRSKLHCAGVRAFFGLASSTASSPTYQAPERVLVEQTVAVYTDRRRMRRGFAAMRSAATRRCIGREVTSAVYENPSVIAVGRAQTLLLDRRPFGHVGWMSRASVSAKTPSGLVPLYVDVILYPKGRDLSFLAVIAAFRPLGTLEQQLCDRIAERFVTGRGA